MNRLLRKIDGKRVALVGNGPEAEDHSAEIDSADVVIRFNHFYNYDSGKVGKRVDIVLQTFTGAWAKTENKHIDAIKANGAEIFIVKKPQQMRSELYKFLGADTPVRDLSRLFAPYAMLTTGGASLCYLADAAKNSEFKVYGFPYGDSWKDYLAKDAAHYRGVETVERLATASAISRLREARIVRPSEGSGQPRAIVVPVKRVSQGAPGKNRALIRPLLGKIIPLGIPVFVVGDDAELFVELNREFPSVEYRETPEIAPLDDVTKTLLAWRDAENFSGEVALVQCTSPRLKPEWITRCLDALKHGVLAATAVELGFKPNAIFTEEEGGAYFVANQRLGFPSRPRQQLPRAIRVTGAVEAFDSDDLDLSSLWAGGPVTPIIVDEEDALDVDRPCDLDEWKKE